MEDFGLEVLQSPHEKKLDANEYFDVGEYDVELGTEVLMYLRNPYKSWVAYIEDLDTVNNNSELYGPQLILPEQTVKLKVVVKPDRRELSLTELTKFMDEDEKAPPVVDTVQGDVIWKRYEVTPQFLDSMQKNKTHMKKLGKKGLR